MALATTHRSTAANLIVPDWQQKENDGSIALANESVSNIASLMQLNGVIGDGPFGATSGDFDAFHFTVNQFSLQSVFIDIDARILGSGLDASIEIYNSAGTLIGNANGDPAGGLDPFIEFTPPANGDYTVIVRGSGSFQSNPNSAGSGSGAGSTGAYRIFIALYLDSPGGSKVLHGDDSANNLIGYEGSYVFVGNGGNDSFDGSDKSDLFIWNAGDGGDTVDGDDGYDVQEVNASGAAERFDLKQFLSSSVAFLDILNGPGGDGYTALASVEGLDVRGLGGADRFMVANLSGTTLFGPIRFWGGAGVDVLAAAGAVNPISVFGEAGNDVLRCGSGADRLNGGIGNDVLASGRGKDLLTGGPGGDRFDFNAIAESTVAAAGRDTIAGLSHAQHDRIDLATIDADQRPANPGNDVFTFIGNAGFAAYHAAHPGVFGMVRFAGGIVEGNVNASLAADFAVRVVGVASLVAGDFFL